MSDAEKRYVGFYVTSDGTEVCLTERQESALQKSCIWQRLGYRFTRYDFAEPTHSDAQIAEKISALCSGYQPITRIVRDPDGYLVADPKESKRFEPCHSFADAVKVAREVFRCDVVTVPTDEFRPEFDSIADHWRVAILIV